MLSVDRIEAGIVICEDEEERIVRLPLSTFAEVPKGGDLLVERDGVYTVDADATAKRREKLFRLSEDLFE